MSENQQPKETIDVRGQPFVHSRCRLLSPEEDGVAASAFLRLIKGE